MIRLRVAVLLCLTLSLGCAPKFDGARYIEHVGFLASDDLAGRAIGTPGIEKAGDYIAEQFRRAGLKPAGDNGTYFQSFEVGMGQQMLGRPMLTVAGAPALGVLGRDFVPFPFSNTDTFEGPLAFAGYGITNLSEEYNDYDGFDAKGKVLLMFRYEPHSKDPKADFGGANPSQHSSFMSKAGIARGHGAKAILIVNPPLHHESRDTLFPFNSLDNPGRYGLPMLHVSQEYARRLLQAAGAPDLVTLQLRLDEKKPHSMDLKGLIARGDPGLVRRKITTRNVIAKLPGDGPATDEYVVIGAHYDHVGRMIPRKPTSKDPKAPRVPEIHNGADDNASGTAGVIELARAFAVRGSPGRGILFIAFSAEEEGLLGSAHYVSHPVVPLEKTVAMLNLDMIGRMRDEHLEVFGTDTAPQFSKLLKYHAGLEDLHMKSSGSGFGGSDHASFSKKHIPALHFFTGLHNDYHMPSDDTEKINAAGGAEVVRLVYNVGYALAGAPNRPTYAAVAQKDRPKTGLKVRLGVMPSYAEDDQQGLKIDGVAAGSPAERAGLHEGDRILVLGVHEVNDVYGLMDAMGHYKPGDSVSIKVLRSGKRIEVGVKFEGQK